MLALLLAACVREPAAKADCAPVDEVPYDGVDQDCDGADLVDVDGDGHDGPGFGDDCDDDDVRLHPGGWDAPYNGLDEDCDGADVRDVDGDGWEAPEVGGEDCDDEASGVYPGAPESCGGADSDCDGAIDPPGDADGDGASDCDDCDDADPAVNPDADELCDNGIDDDCDGSAGDCAFATRGIAGSAFATIEGETDDFFAGSALAAGDLDGDGVDELVAGAIWAGGGDGAVATFPLPLPAYQTFRDAEHRWDATEVGEQLGYALVVADLDGDGRDDVATGAPWGSSGGSVFVAYAPFYGWGTFGDAQITGVGRAVAAGDLDGDGILDLGVGSNGEAAVALGPLEGRTSAARADYTFTTDEDDDGLGLAIDFGDLDGDGRDDVAIGAPIDYYAGPGLVYVVTAPTLGTYDLADALRVVGSGSEAQAGWHITLADVDGDEQTDLLVASDFVDTVSLVLGPIRADVDLGSPDARLDGVSGKMLVADLDHDGVLDVTAGTYDRLEVHGGPLPAWPAVGTPIGTLGLPEYPTGLLAGDFDRDGVTDLAVGVSHMTGEAGSWAGAVQVVTMGAGI